MCLRRILGKGSKYGAVRSFPRICLYLKRPFLQPLARAHIQKNLIASSLKWILFIRCKVLIYNLYHCSLFPPMEYLLFSIKIGQEPGHVHFVSRLWFHLCLVIVADVGTNFQEDTFAITCPAGCIEDPSRGTVYGSNIFTEVSSSSLPRT